jgi:hypothetical protein
MITEKTPKSFNIKVLKSVSNKKNTEKSVFAALCCKVVFYTFCKKLIVLL